MSSSKHYTRKELITTKYNELILSLKDYITASIFPSLEEMDLVDIIFFFNLYFKSETTYKLSLKDLLELKNINVNDKQLDDIYNIVLPFIIWLKTLQ